MKHFTSVHDIPNLNQWVNEALKIKSDPLGFVDIGGQKTLGLVFLNPSLRTRMSTQKAAMNLGMNTMVINMDKEGWRLEMNDNVIMDGFTVEHIKEAAAVLGQYCDVLGLRCFPNLKDRNEDYSEEVLNKFIKYCGVPVVSLESATRHPLQSFADLITIKEMATKSKPKVVLTWAPHVKPLPQAVSNSFSEWMIKAQELDMVDFVITHPEGYELAEEFTKGAKITTNQNEALKDADFVYVKNWSSYSKYGEILTDGKGWMIDNEKLKLTDNAKVLHCLPVRRGLELADEILDGPNSLVIHEAGNRVYAAQTALKKLIEINRI
ncbi:Rossmann-fold NAD(P)-binding domain-containing protein [Solitalea canadensis]|uniref:N-succinylornithine carbamoyltransferase n=1 Tax=Solitalea canadensis (strain ATCC 29591 / DSM 3403 / JCM 21819 / LMG 8368 / NBRC 15130 / NCIMB 12057 / USAM 9D) TaxID=929556 RepID=H8KSK7_SOLCM|nr:acetylornithine carbamoyltransferase [Solitalea canadensis]AFD08558.1 ornithine carbamoyltransferase [Solitalea canadensis DSM 3403]